MVAALVLSVVVAACGGGTSDEGPGSGGDGGNSEAGADKVLNLAFSSDMDPPDPDTNYQMQGNQVTTSLYEGLVDYAPDGSAEIVPMLAESWEVSDDQLTYTFTLREGVTFHDGTELTSESLLAGFERRVNEAVESPMSYMLLPVAGYETPDPLTFVIKLEYPESAFLSYLASPFSPKAISPKALEENEVDGDAATEWLRTHDAGTGPYTLTKFELGQEYVLERYADYWGDEPYFETVEIAIVPDAASQVVQFEGGDLDIITGQPAATVETFEDEDGVEIVQFPVLQKAWVHVNTVRPPTDDLPFREALRAAIDRPTLVEQVWGDYATESTQMYPVENVPEGQGTDEWEYDPSLLEDVGEGNTIDIGFPSDSPTSQLAAETLQTQFGEAGLDAELVPLTSAETYDLQSDVPGAPHLYVESSYPDSHHPDTWARLFWYADIASGAGGFLNYLGAGTPESDELLNTGLGATDQAVVDDSYGKSGDLVHDQVGYITLADVDDTFIAREGLSGFAHWLPTPLTLQLKSIEEGDV